MIVSHEYKFIFLKTRKTAGTSLEIALSQLCGERDIITPIAREDEAIRQKLGFCGPQNYWKRLSRYTLRDWARYIIRKRRTKGYSNHMPAKEAQSLLGSRIWNEYYKFCFERNPWDKAISLYFYETHGMQPRPPLLDFLQSMFVPPHLP